MARRTKIIEPEIMPPASVQPKTKIVQAKHKIEYDAPVTVPVDTEDAPEDEQPIYTEDLVEEVEKRRRRKSAKDEREDLRREMDKIGVAPMTRLRLTIEKYKHSDSLDSGVTADKIYCTKYGVTRDHVLNDDFLDVARQYGPGRYWLTLRLDNKVVRQWDREITMPQNGQIVQQINPSDPSSPHVIVNVPESGQQILPGDPFKEAERALSFVKKYNDAFGIQAQVNAPPSKTEDEVLATAILKQPDVIESVVGNVIKRFGRNGSSGEDDPSPWAVAMKLVETGQAAAMLKTLVDSVFNGFRGMIPGGMNNGAQTMASTPLQTDRSADYQRTPDGRTATPQEISQGNQVLQQTNGTADREGGMLPNGDMQAQTPADQALMTVLNDCARKIPPQVTFGNLMTYADFLNDQAPAYSIDGWITFFATMSIDDVIEFVKTLPNGEQAASLPHAKEWTEQFQKLIRESQEGEE